MHVDCSVAGALQSLSVSLFLIETAKCGYNARVLGTCIDAHSVSKSHNEQVSVRNTNSSRTHKR